MMAHELAHIKNRDTLIMTITATIAGAISMLAQFGMFFGGNRDNNNGMGIIGTLAMVILAPIAAMLVQMAISRTREYAADRIGARDRRRAACGSPRRSPRSTNAAHADPERGGRAQSRDRAHVHHQSAVGRSAWTTCSRPIRRPRTASPRCSSLPREMGRSGYRPRRSRPAPAHGAGARSLGRRRAPRSVGLSRQRESNCHASASLQWQK